MRHPARLLWVLACGLSACTPKDGGAPPADSGEAPAPDCPVTFTWTSTADPAPDEVVVAGSFNGWDTTAHPLEPDGAGGWSGTLMLPPGPHAYKIVERSLWTADAFESWACDPAAPYIQCDEGYKEPWVTDFAHTCGSGTSSACNSMIVVPDCRLPTLTVQSLAVDRAGGAATVQVQAAAGARGGGLERVVATLDGAPVEASLGADGGVRVELRGLAVGRHTLRAVAVAEDGAESEELYVPFWTDAGGDAAWSDGPMYFAFVDRFANGDPANDAPTGASLPAGEYLGGDFAGLTARLDLLAAMGVRTLWISNPQDNAEGAWAGDCGHTYSAYHAYWPSARRDIEARFGDDAALRALVDGAHARGMRVIMDWVGNHLHETHPWAAEHGGEWFHPPAICKDNVDGWSNWDRIPESCWFAPYLPDIDYAQLDPLHLMVDDALWWVKTYGLDGLRVDAVKHMPHSVAWNLEARVRAEVEHRAAGGDEQFWTVGETFDGHARIAEYLHAGDTRLGLDAQFDFPLYYAVSSVFAQRTGHFGDLEAALAASEAAYGGVLMSSFLGNHDVSRFVTRAAEGDFGACDPSTGVVAEAAAPEADFPYERLRLAFAFLFTQRDVPLVYTGDEIGQPGYGDPDNRQPWFWDTGGALTLDDALAALPANRAAVLREVAALGQARRAHPALWRATPVEWWRAPADRPSLWATARVDAATGDEAIVILNLDDTEHTLENGLAYAGLSSGGTFVDVLDGSTFTASGDRLSVRVPPRRARVLVRP